MHHRSPDCGQREYPSSFTISLMVLPVFSGEKVLRHFPKHGTSRVPRAVVDKTNVAAPTLIARNLMGFGLARLRFPENLQIHTGIAQVADRFSHFTGANPSVKIN